jgi:hypothetical protein
MNLREHNFADLSIRPHVNHAAALTPEMSPTNSLVFLACNVGNFRAASYMIAATKELTIPQWGIDKNLCPRFVNN